MREQRLRKAFAGRAVVVTGASRGIGAAAAMRLGAAGAELVLLARDAVALGRVADGIRAAGGSARVIAVDLRDTEATTAAADRILTEVGPPALVLANAGHSIHRAALQSAERAHDAHRLVAVNHLGHVGLLLHLLPSMTATGRGRVVVSSSAALAVPTPGWAAYAASKAAAERWARDVDAEVRPLGVTLGVVRLPLVQTAMAAPTAAYADARALSPERAADRLLRSAVGRRRRSQPWWGPLATAGVALAPGAAASAARRWEARIVASQGSRPPQHDSPPDQPAIR